MKRPRHTDKQYSSSYFECIKFDHKSYEADITRYIEKIEKELQKIVVIVLYKKEQMDVLESEVKLYKPLADEFMQGKKDIEIENKKLIESVEVLLILVDPKLSILSSHETHIWNEVVENAHKLLKQNKS